MEWVKLWNKKCCLYFSEASIESFSDSKFFPMHTLELLITVKKDKQIAVLPKDELKKIKKWLEKSYMSKEGFVLFEGYFEDVCSNFIKTIKLKDYNLFEKYVLFWKAYKDFVVMGHIISLWDKINKESIKKSEPYSIENYKRLFSNYSKTTEGQIDGLFKEIGKKFNLTKNEASMLLSNELILSFEKKKKPSKVLIKARQNGFLLYYDSRPMCITGESMHQFMHDNKIKNPNHCKLWGIF